jgi:single-stranded-DNA-specific exonuclease
LADRCQDAHGAGAGATWIWGGATLDHDLVSAIAARARRAPSDDLDRHRNPSLRAFLPDPSLFKDMDVAAERLAQAVLS